MLIKVKKNIIGCIGFLMYMSISYATNSISEPAAQTEQIPNQVMLDTIYSYLDFHFNSQTSESFNQYQGHSNLYIAGGDIINKHYDIVWGLFLYKADTQVTNRLMLPGMMPSKNAEKIYGNNLFAHVLKQVYPSISLDLLGGYGEYVTYNSLFYPYLNETVPVGQSRSNSRDWFISATALYTHIWQRLTFNGKINYLHNNLDEPAFNFHLNSLTAPQLVPALTNKSSYIIEDAEVVYAINEKLYPFINFELLQVVQYSNSRPLINGIIIGPIPEFNLNENGYRLGGGFSLKHKQITLRFEQQYVRRSHIYHSNQSIISLMILA